jgi:TolA-binding protein
MTFSRSLTLTCALLAGAAAAHSQTPPPPPPAPPQPAAAAPVAVPAPAPPPAVAAEPTPKAAPRAIRLEDMDDATQAEVRASIEAARDQIDKLRDLDFKFELNSEIRAQIEAAKEQAQKFKFEFDRGALNEQMDAVREQLKDLEPQIAYAKGFGADFGASIGKGFAFVPQIAPMPPVPPKPATAPMPRRIGNMSAESAYSNGQRALDDRRWDNAVDYFSQVISRGTSRVDGALYWKAYALAKLNKRDEALATIAELSKSYASSKWSDDAKALALQINQAGGTFVSPEAESDEDLKLLAIQGLMQNDPERYLPALEKILKGSGSPKLKRNALYVLAESNSPKAQGLVEQIARGSSGNPDLQVKAINYLGDRRRNSPNNGQMLAEIYAASNDYEVKRAALQGLVSMRDKDRLLSLIKNEKNPDLRSIAIDYLGNIPGNAELWQIYQTETTSEGKLQVLRHAYSNGNAEKVLEVLRTEKDPKLRIQAAHVLASYGSSQTGDALIAAYNAEQDPQVKNSIADAIFSQRNGKVMVDLAKSEKDPKLKLRMVERLANQRNCKECSDYLVEILNK